MALRIVHILFIVSAAIGLLYAWHMYSSHGSFSSAKAGLGVH